MTAERKAKMIIEQHASGNLENKIPKKKYTHTYTQMKELSNSKNP